MQHKSAKRLATMNNRSYLPAHLGGRPDGEPGEDRRAVERRHARLPAGRQRLVAADDRHHKIAADAGACKNIVLTLVNSIRRDTLRETV